MTAFANTILPWYAAISGNEKALLLAVVNYTVYTMHFVLWVAKAYSAIKAERFEGDSQLVLHELFGCATNNAFALVASWSGNYGALFPWFHGFFVIHPIITWIKVYIYYI